MNWSYGVQGKITDTDGNPIEGASVGILVAGVEKYLKHLTTDENGEYRYHIEPGSYDSRISADDHIAPDYSERTQRDRFEVKEGGITNLSRSLLNVEGKYVMGVTAHVITSTNVANAIPVHATFSWEDVTIERGNHWGFMLVSTTPVVRLTSSYTYTHESVQYTKSNFVKDIDITALKTGNFSLSWYYDHD